jgi:hypothetical protein
MKIVKSQTHSNKNYSKFINTLFAVQFRRNFEIFGFEFYIKKLVIKIIDLTTWIWSKIQNLQLLFPYNFKLFLQVVLYNKSLLIFK